MLKLSDLAQFGDFEVGDLRISPARRRVEGPRGSIHVEPQFMFVFMHLLEAAGDVVTRVELFDRCWGGAAVGDDSLNRAIGGARQMATAVGSNAFTIETIPRTGYALRLAPGVTPVSVGPKRQERKSRLQSAVEEAYDCWRSGLPVPDHDAIAGLGEALSEGGGDAFAWGMYALLLRKAAEYADHDECSNFVSACEKAARRALALEEGQTDAQVALAGLVPLFGNWSAAREKLISVRQSDCSHAPAAHDLAVLEMATGRPSAARPLIEELIARDPLAATFYYKRIYHLWTFGQIDELDDLAARALQLWPRHPAIWTARLWSLVFTGRAQQALQMLSDESWPAPLPPPAVQLLQRTIAAAASPQSGGNQGRSARETAVAEALNAVSRGPAQAVAGLLSLLALDAIDQAFDVAYGYYLGRGSNAVPLRWSKDDPSITDQHRRVTQVLFIPAAARMREDDRFAQLCSDIGRTAHWERFGITPDFAAS